MASSCSRPRLLVFALCVAVAATGCGSDDKSKAVPAVGGEGDRASGSGNTSSGGTDSAGPGEPGEFGSIWRRATAELTVVDAMNPTATVNAKVDIPNKVTHEEYETDVELFEQIEDDELILYAHYDDAEVYLRVVYPLMKDDDSYVLQSSSGATGLYSLEEGVLKLTQTLTSDMTLVLSESHYQKYTGDFPPADWPTDLLELEGAALP